MADANLLARAFVPVANVEDTATTLDAALPRIAAAGGQITVVHVIEKAGGAADKASVEQREELAEEAFTLARERGADAGVAVETELRYGTDVAETIVEAAHDTDATAIVFTPRGSKWWWDLFGDDVSDALLHDSDLPVVMLPSASSPEATDEDEAGADKEVTDGG